MQKKRFRPASLLLGAAALITACAALLLCLSALGSPPLYLSAKGSAEEVSALFMDSLCAGDYDRAAAYCSTALPEENAPADDDAAMIYAALRESLAWEQAGEVQQKGFRAMVPVRLHHLDMTTLTEGLKEEVNAILAVYVEQAASAADIYNDDGSYRDEVVMRAWNEALETRLSRKDDYMTSTLLPLYLSAGDGSWKAAADEALLRALSGGL